LPRHPDQSLEWSDAGVEGSNRFLKRVWRLATSHLEGGDVPALDLASLTEADRDVRRKLHETIGKIEADIHERQSFNTAVAALMELSNALIKFEASTPNSRAVAREAITTLLILLTPFAPTLGANLVGTVWY
jgi:leucyl-tRNA synthetase